jgi:hypothetical protein
MSRSRGSLIHRPTQQVGEQGDAGQDEQEPT